MLITLLVIPGMGKDIRIESVPDRLERTRPADEYKVHNTGTMCTATSNFANYGDPNVPEGLPSMEWPCGSGTHHLWEGRLWVSAMVEGEKRSSHADYGNYEFHPSDGSSFDLRPILPISEDSYTTSMIISALTPPQQWVVSINQRGLTWSTPDYDDFVIYEVEIMKDLGGDDYSGSELNDFIVSWVYDCDVGTGTDPNNPHIDDLVDFDGWDGNNPSSQITYMEDIVENGDLDSDGGIEGYDDLGIPYGWKNVGSASITQPNYDLTLTYPDGFYDEYTVFIPEDPSSAPMIRWQADASNPDYDAVAGEIAVVGEDTLRGYVVPRNMSYMYDGDDPTSPEDDTNENTSVSGFIGGSLIYTDYWKWYGAYNETDDDTLMRVFTHQWWNWESDPGSDRDKFDYGMGQHVESRGNKFMPHPFSVGAPTFDYRFMLTSGPFDGFSLGDTIRLVYVATVGEGIGGLRQNADNALEAYYAGSESNPYNPSAPNEGTHYLLPVPPPVPVLAYSPMDKGVRLSWDNSAELEVDPLVGAADFEGYRVYRATFNPEGWEMIAAFDNYDGPVNIIDFSTGDTLYDGQLFDLPDLEHSWVDTQTAFLCVR